MSPDQRIAELEARIAELEQRATRPMRRPRLTRPLALLAVTVALLLPAGAVLASHQFSDVPTSHQFHTSIDAIADAGITTGCGGGRYCPDGLVTRGQMAAFLNRLGALTPGSAPKVNAKSTDGWSLGCPASTTYSGGLCFDTSTRGTATGQLDALRKCAEIGAGTAGARWHLPAASRLLAAAQTTSLNLASTFEWTSDFWFDELGAHRGIVLSELGGSDQAIEAAQAMAAQYRCATEPLSRDS